MDHTKIKSIFADLYNGFYLKNRKEEQQRTDEEWEKIISDAQKYIDKYNEPLVKHIVEDLIYYFEKQEEEKIKKQGRQS